jgi:PleD family two-component response regulator
MRVRQQDVANVDRLAFDDREQIAGFVAGIDEHAFTGRLAREHETVLEERSDRAHFHYHWLMILALVDDLMFRSKIKSAATHTGVDVRFAASPDSALAAMRTESPALVIFDLNNTRADPLGTLAAMKRDAALASIPTVGYVSHVDATTIDAARAAGVDDVLARSAFAMKLAELLTNPPPRGGTGGRDGR